MLIMRIVNREEGSATSRDILEQDPSVGGGSHGLVGVQKVEIG
jgi:hypothetical protein